MYDEILVILPHLACMITTFVISICRSTYIGQPPTINKRLLDAILCSFSAVALSLFAKNHFTDLYRSGDGMIIGVCMGYLGISQIGDFFINFLKKKGFSNDK